MGAATAAQRYVGGQAVVEGVMMRGERTWAVAIRTPEGGIQIETHEAPTWAEKWSKVPLVRGVMALAESMALGFKALSWSANQQIPEEEQISSKAMGWTIGAALLFFTAIFIVLPAVAANGLGDALGVDGTWFHVAEGVLRLAIFIGYLALIAQLADIKRVFQYHGAEHKAIAAYENNVELSAEEAQKFSTQHVRCGTNFLLTVMVVTIVVYSFIGRPGWLVLIASRVVLIPLIAGLSYEVIRFAAGHMQWRWVRVLMRPGLALQRLTTREPTLDQVEVAITSLRAVLTAEQLAEVERRSQRVAPATGRPAFGPA
ncbi:MAG TPA: DUF1385 domain-containing protein [Acidimicrobiia bacterium]|nr:DUF1385 domain-containing protein [Acidimicrobiia bacterium]